VEARQRVKLSLTNRSIGLISAVAERQIAFDEGVPRSGKPAKNPTRQPQPHPSRRITHPHDTAPASRALGRLVDLVVIARGPHPIPSRTRP
jgi:hypothetical protein